MAAFALAFLAALAAIGAAMLAIFNSDGWGVLIWAPVCVLIAVVHLGILAFAARMSSRASALVKLALLASVCFVAAFLLQVDEGDGPRWIIAMAVFADHPPRLPRWWPFWINLLAFVPLIGAWTMLLRRAHRS